jgi:hypothetical protein
MVTRNCLLSAIMTITLASPLFARHSPADTTRTDLRQVDLPTMLGQPTANASVGGVQMKVWLMTLEQHKEIMKQEMSQMPMHADKEGEIGRLELMGIDHANVTKAIEMKGIPYDSVGTKNASLNTYKDTVDAIQGSQSMNKATMHSMTAGTHHIVLDVTEIASGKEIAGASARLLIESPSKKSSSVDLKSMMEHFGGTLTLDEKGEYRFTVNVSFGGVTKTTQFQYAVK